MKAHFLPQKDTRWMKMVWQLWQNLPSGCFGIFRHVDLLIDKKSLGLPVQLIVFKETSFTRRKTFFRFAKMRSSSFEVTCSLISSIRKSFMKNKITALWRAYRHFIIIFKSLKWIVLLSIVTTSSVGCQLKNFSQYMLSVFSNRQIHIWESAGIVRGNLCQYSKPTAEK